LLWLAVPAMIASCSSASGSSAPTPAAAAAIPETVATTSSAPPVATAATSPATTPEASAPTSSTSPPPSTSVPVDPTILIPIAVGNKPFPADGDELATLHDGYTGDPNATLQTYLITPMGVPSGPDVRLLGFERAVGEGTNSTTATFLTGAIDPEAALATIEAALAPSPTYTVTPTTRTEGTVTIHGFDAQPTTVVGDPPGWSVEASTVDQLGIIRIKRIDYAFAKVVPTFADLPAVLQKIVLNPDAIAVYVGGLMSSIGYEYGVGSLADTPSERTHLDYNIDHDFATASANLSALLTTGWDISEQSDVMYFTSTTTPEVWTLDEIGGGTHLTYDTGS
jgi:hypothetical protein